VQRVLEEDVSVKGEVLGWIMAAIYMGGRLPQIWLNVCKFMHTIYFHFLLSFFKFQQGGAETLCWLNSWTLTSWKSKVGVDHIRRQKFPSRRWSPWTNSCAVNPPKIIWNQFFILKLTYFARQGLCSTAWSVWVCHELMKCSGVVCGFGITMKLQMRRGTVEVSISPHCSLSWSWTSCFWIK